MLIQTTHGLVLKLPLGWLFTMIQKNKTNGPYCCILCKKQLYGPSCGHSTQCHLQPVMLMDDWGKTTTKQKKVLTSNQTREEMRWQGYRSRRELGRKGSSMCCNEGGKSSSHRAETVYKLNPRRNEPNVLWRTQQRCKQADYACAAKCRAWTVRAGANQKMS